MPNPSLSTASARRAYVLTKLAVLGAALLLTWPLSHWLGPKAWWGLGIFACVLGMTTVAMLLFTRPKPSADAAQTPGIIAPPPVEDEPVQIPIEDFIDLHPFPPKDIPDVVRDYLQAAHAAGFREVRLIHGRGIGVQRERVRSLLASHPLVVSFHDAPPDRGGWGATEVSLRD